MTARPADEARRALRAARERAAQGPDPTAPAGQETPRPGDVAREALRRAVSEHRGSGRGGEDRASGEGRASREGAATGEGVAEDTGAPDDTRAVGTPPEPEAPADPQEGPTGPAPADARPGKEAGQGSTADRDSDWSDRATGRPDGETDWADRDTDWSGRDSDRPGRDTGRPDQPDSNTDRPGPRAADIAREALRAARDDARRAREETEREGARRRRRARQSAVDDRAAAARRAGDHGAGGAVRDVQELLSGAFRLPSLPDTTPDDRPDAAPDPREETAGHRSPSSPLADLPHGSTVRAPEGPDSAGSPGTPSGSSTDATTDATPAPNPTRSTPAPNPTPTRSTPRSMAAPHRDSDHRRTFPPFPAREGTTFAESWWGNAWVGALEQGALDAKRLERGRGYAEQGHVDAITVTPGLVLAYVRGSRPRPYRVQVRLRTLGDSDWDRFLDAAADRPGHIAALLDKEMPHSLADCGVPLLPGPGDLEPRCSCPDRGHPCKHAAALCYQTARLLDADPFVLLLLRGRGERELLDALSRLSATRAARAAQDREPAPTPGVRAGDVVAPRALPPLPAPLPAPPHPEQPPAYPAAPGGPDPFALDQLATDAAARAHALLTTGRDPVGQLTLWQDAVRLAAARPGSGLTAGTRALYSSLAAAAGRTPSDLARAVAAWRQGGLEGLAVLEEPWDPPAGRFDRARPLLLAADLPAFRPWRNHLTHPRGHVQLRLGRDGLWYAYESEPGQDDWWPRGTPDLDPVGALTGLGIPGEP
ncbi:hypothetical protein DF19_38635 [Streptomyces olindensis]|nr:hypothetical protein DF19_38635 [Streptomyces olindensis]